MCQSALDALILGRKFLAENSWGRYRNVRRCNGGTYYCAVGALMYGAFYSKDQDGIGGFHLDGRDLVFEEAVQALDRSASRVHGSDIYIQKYNDYLAESRADILYVYEGAIHEMAGKLDEQRPG